MPVRGGPEVITYTYHLLQKLEERQLRIGWVDRVVNKPDWTMPDPNEPGAIRAFGPVPERDMRIMRVVYVPEGDDKRVITAFLDRGAKRP